MYEKLWRYVEWLEKMGLRGKLSRSFRERREKAIKKIEAITSIVDVWRGWAKEVVDEQKSSKLGRMTMMLEPRYVEWYNALYTRDLGPSVVVEAVEGPLHVPVKVAVDKHEHEDCVLYKIKNALLDVAADMAVETAEWLNRYGSTLAAAVYRYLIPLMKDMLNELEERRKELKL